LISVKRLNVDEEDDDDDDEASNSTPAPSAITIGVAP
jgi:hypothetical protein